MSKVQHLDDTSTAIETARGSYLKYKLLESQAKRFDVSSGIAYSSKWLAILSHTTLQEKEKDTRLHLTKILAPNHLSCLWNVLSLLK